MGHQGLLYRTGDYVRVENGLLYYEGRCDSQIKVRGHRVDLSEIEKTVKSFEVIDKAVVLCYKPNEPAQKVLCYFTVKTKEEKVNKYSLLMLAKNPDKAHHYTY